MEKIKSALKPTPLKRALYYLTGEALAASAGGLVAVPSKFHLVAGVGFIAIVLFGLLTGFYRMKWGAFGLRDAVRTFLGTAAGALGVAGLWASGAVPWQAPLLWFSAALPVLLIARGGKVFAQWAVRSFRRMKKPRCLLVCPDSSAGAAVSYALDNPLFGYRLLGVVSENPHDSGALVQGVRVLGTVEELPRLVSRLKPDAVVVLETPDGLLKRAWKAVSGLGVEVRVLAARGKPRKLQLKDVVGREPIRVNLDEISQFVRGKRVLITGAGGTVGSALARRLAQFEPREIILFEREETALFRIAEELKESRAKIIPFLGDITSEADLEECFAEHGPQLVFHAAAYKHVPVLERYPEKAFWNNVCGTYKLASAALKWGTEVFVNISTDKAVEPSSVMGASKALAERLVLSFNGRGKTTFASVRFGNVFGSRGSVVELIERWLDQGKPIRLTHPKMERYFMSVDEAVLLVLEAAALKLPGVLVLNMGRPVRIYELAENIVRLRGLEPGKDVKFEFTGPRPGEKLVEKLAWEWEELEPINGGNLFLVKSSLEVKQEELSYTLNYLSALAKEGRREELRESLLEAAYGLVSGGVAV